MNYLLRQKKVFVGFVFIFLMCTSLTAQKICDCKQVPVLLRVMDKFHYESISIDHAVSEEIKKSFVTSLDPYQLLFLSTDINFLINYNVDFNDPSSKSVCAYLQYATTLYQSRIQSIDSLLGIIMSSSLDYYAQDSIVFFADDQERPIESIAAQHKLWVAYIKYVVLNQLFTDEPNEEKSVTKDVDVKTLLLSEPDMRAKLCEKEKLKLKRILDYPDGITAYMTSQLLNAIASRYDPHSCYLSPSKKENFEKAVSTEVYMYGFSFDEDQHGEVVISRIVPGSPAWKSNALNNGDKILSIAVPGKKAIDLSNAGVDEAERVFQSLNSTELELVVKKVSGVEKRVTLKKEKIAQDENLIKSYLLKGEKTFGYISLPDFYTDILGMSAQGCANDMAKEIVKLKKENIEGLIIDLRNNGGGAMNEAFDMAGIFINEGPLSILKEQGRSPYSFKDMNRGTIYDGPLIIIVNKLSASASELLAATLQDYNRALIVGGATFGKASMQIIVPLDSSLSPELPDPPKTKNSVGFVKVTTGKFYRITGKSHQQRGVIPDVQLPDMLDYSLKNDSVSKKVYYTPLSKFPVNELVMKSRARIKEKPYFNTITHFADSLKKSSGKNMVYSLNINDFKEENAREIFNDQQLDSSITKASTVYSVANNQFDREIILIDENKRELNDGYLKGIQDDIYIEEVFQIMNDLIKLKITN